MSGRSLKILVAGKLSAVPYQGGWAWVILQYLLGLKQLGHEVYFVEHLPESAVPAGVSLVESLNARYFFQVLSEFGLEQNSSLIVDQTHETVGLSYADVSVIANRADVLLNVSGAFRDDVLAERIPIRIYLDLDPAFTQMWQSQNIDMHFDGATHFATVGLAMDQPSCRVPRCGSDWIPVRQPIVLEHWPAANGCVNDAITTVANWRGYGSIEYDGVFYGQKAHSLRQFINVPHRTAESFCLALSIHPDEWKDIAALLANDWHIVDPSLVAATPALYRQFVQDSKAEFGIAKSGYVTAQCGWFSDRSVCYLASARPVIAQDTGFNKFLPTGEGLFAFKTEDDVMAAIEAFRSDYSRQSSAARSIAVEFFDSRKVLSDLLEKTGAVM
jgi:hypothetical protein